MQDLSHRQLDSSIEPGSCHAKSVMGLSGCCCSLPEQSKSVLHFQTGALRETWVSEPIEAPKLQELHLCPSKAKSSPELRKLSPFSVPVTLLAWIHFFFSTTKVTIGLENSLCLLLLLKDTHAPVESLEMPVLRGMDRTCKSSLQLPATWPTHCGRTLLWACRGEHTSTAVHEVPRQAGRACCCSNPRIAVWAPLGTGAHHLCGKLLSLPASCCSSLCCSICLCVVTNWESKW